MFLDRTVKKYSYRNALYSDGYASTKGARASDRYLDRYYGEIKELHKYSLLKYII